MPEGPDGKAIIIVKKVVGHGGHHGGAWKVAYADFITSMMALFLVLWLVSSANSSVRNQVSAYVLKSGVFSQGSGTPLEVGGAGILPESFAPQSVGEAAQEVSNKDYEASVNKGEVKDAFMSGEGKSEQSKEEKEQAEQVQEEQKKSLQSLAKEIEDVINGEGVTGTELGKVEVKVDQRGLHLEIMDTEKESMFQRGSADILPSASGQLKKIAALLMTLPNPIDIDGHTDATPYRALPGRAYDNWNLSTDRANAARQVLQGVGIKDSQIARVVGYAATRLRVPDDAMAPANRRISISMRLTEQALKTLAPIGAQQTQSVPLRPHASPARGIPVVAEPVAAPTLKASATPEQKKPEGKLDVQIGISQPEGTEIKAPEVRTDGKVRPAWMDNDKIFNDADPFFVEPPKGSQEK